MSFSKYNKKKSIKKYIRKFNKKAKGASLSKYKGIVPFGLGFPRKAIVTHKYHDLVQLTSTYGSVANLQYVANGMWDPDFTLGGHKPIYFNQLSSIYNHYHVIGSKIIFRITAALPSSMAMAVCYLNDDTVITPATNGYFEQSTSKHVSIPNNTIGTHTIVRNFSAKKIFGGSILGNNKLRGDAATNPVEQSVYSLLLYCPLTGTGTFNVEVDVEYTAIWTEVRDVISS